MEHPLRRLMLLGLLATLACEPRTSDEPLGVWADLVHDAPGADSDLAFGDPSLAANGAYGVGCCAGGMDVYSISPALGREHLILRFSVGPLFDRDGPDLVVFENPFDIAAGGRFMDPAVILVSSDGLDFATFPVDYLAPDPTVYSDNPEDWLGFAGITPVHLNEADEIGDPFAAGGDAFDLQDLSPGPLRQRILMEGARYVMVVPATSEIDPATGEPYPSDPIADGPDIDAIYGRLP